MDQGMRLELAAQAGRLKAAIEILDAVIARKTGPISPNAKDAIRQVLRITASVAGGMADTLEGMDDDE